MYVASVTEDEVEKIIKGLKDASPRWDGIHAKSSNLRAMCTYMY